MANCGLLLPAPLGTARFGGYAPAGNSCTAAIRDFPNPLDSAGMHPLAYSSLLLGQESLRHWARPVRCCGGQIGICRGVTMVAASPQLPCHCEEGDSPTWQSPASIHRKMPHFLTFHREIAPQAFPSVPRRFAPRNDSVFVGWFRWTGCGDSPPNCNLPSYSLSFHYTE